jgi:hypothetical protein
MLVFGKDDRRWPTSCIYEDAQGRFAYYPFGKLSRGHILPNAEAADALEKKVALSTSLIACAIAIVIGALIAFDASLFLAWPAILLGLVCLFLYSGLLARRFPASEEPFDPDALRQGLQTRISRRHLIYGLMFFGVMFAANVAGGAQGHPWLHAFALASSATLLAWIGWLLLKQYRT